MGDFELGVGFENHTSRPSAGDVLFYPGGYSETELLIAYGACSFASRMGPLAGSHFMTLLDARQPLRSIGQRVLWHGAVEVGFELDDAAICGKGGCMNPPRDLVGPFPLGTSAQTQWLVDAKRVDMSAAPPPPRPIALASTPQQVTLDLNRTALMVIDMQNDFCTAGGWVDHLGADYGPDRTPIAPLQRLLPPWREAGGRVVWVNWGNRPDLANMPANQHHLYKPTGQGIGLGEPLPDHGAPVLQKDSWAAAVVDDLVVEPTDICVDKHRISGFWDTPLDSILRNLGIRTILFAGVNTDQCVLHSLTDANFLGYGCVLLEDCCATTSPGFCTEATLWNVRKCFGFIANSTDVIEGLKTQR